MADKTQPYTYEQIAYLISERLRAETGNPLSEATGVFVSELLAKHYPSPAPQRVSEHKLTLDEVQSRIRGIYEKYHVTEDDIFTLEASWEHLRVLDVPAPQFISSTKIENHAATGEARCRITFAAPQPASVSEEQRDADYSAWRDGYGESHVRPKDAWDAGWLSHSRCAHPTPSPQRTQRATAAICVTIRLQAQFTMFWSAENIVVVVA